MYKYYQSIAKKKKYIDYLGLYVYYVCIITCITKYKTLIHIKIIDFYSTLENSAYKVFLHF